MNNTEVTGLVVRTTDLKESDRIINIYTREMGMVSALAKGARTLKSRKLSSTMQFCYSTFQLYKRGEYYQVKESELIESFFGIRNSIEALALATYICEVIGEVAVTEADNDLLRLALNSLYAISEEKYPLEKIKAAFEVRCAAIIGFMPDVLTCSSCGEKMGDFYLDIMGGYLKCYRCREEEAQKRTSPENPHEARIITILSEGAKIAFGYCVHAPLEKLFSFKISDEDMQLFSRAAELYILHQLERSFKSLEFYKEVSR